MRESSLKPNAQSATSSATGLFQFIEQTWLGLVKEHGAQHGVGNLANAITRDANGRYRADASVKQNILALRKDPQLCALMAGEHAKSTQGQLQASLGREICGGELYAAHFLGPDAATRLIRLAEKDPGASAAANFPQAASANRSVFYHADGRSKSAREVYDWALRQPGAKDTIRVATLPDITPAAPTPDKARPHVVTTQSDEIEILLASVMNWQPRGGQRLFGLGSSGSTPSSTLSFGSSRLSLFSDAKKSTTSS